MKFKWFKWARVAPFIVALAGLLLVLGCETTNTAPMAPPKNGGIPHTNSTNPPPVKPEIGLGRPLEDPLRIGDKVRIEISNVPTVDTRPSEQQISENGTISLPLIGDIKA